MNFYNPEDNTCYFRFSLKLKADDGEGMSGKTSSPDEEGKGETALREIENAVTKKVTLWISE